MKSINNRNFESGLISDDPQIVGAVMDLFHAVWIGSFCKTCGRRAYCGDPIV